MLSLRLLPTSASLPTTFASLLRGLLAEAGWGVWEPGLERTLSWLNTGGSTSSLLCGWEQHLISNLSEPHFFCPFWILGFTGILVKIFHKKHLENRNR